MWLATAWALLYALGISIVTTPLKIFLTNAAYWLYIAYMLGFSAATFAILITAFRNRALYFHNTLALTLGILVPGVIGVLSALGLLPVRGFDWVPISFIWMGALYGWAILSSHLLDVVPMARSTVVEHLDDLMIVLNRRGSILDLNRSAQTALKLSPPMVGASPMTLSQPWAGIFQRHAGTASSSEEITFDLDGSFHAYELLISPIHDRRARLIGRLFLFHDITKRKQAEADERKQRILAEALRDTSSALNSTLDFDGVLEKILKNVERVVPIDSANIALLDDNGKLRYVHFYGYETHMVSEKELKGLDFSLETAPIYKKVAASGEPMIISDTHADPDWIITTSGAWIRSYAVMPIRIKEKVVGFLNLDSAQAGLYTPEHIQNLRALADQAAIAVENARLFAAAEHELLERRQVEEKLGQLSHAVEQSPVSIMITDIRGNIEYVNPRFSQVTGYSFEEAVGKNPRILNTDKTLPGTHRQLWETITAGREWQGEFVNQKKNGEEYYESASISPIVDAQGNITHYVAVKEDITGRKKAEEEIHEANRQLQIQLDANKLLQAELLEQAIRDPLTGLYNRRQMSETLVRELARAEREKYPVSFVMIDLDHFKHINDTFGHNVGDAVLQRLATQLLSQARLADIIYRYGGEEFLAILPNVTATIAFQITERWRLFFMGSTLPLEYNSAKATISCGISEYSRHGRTSDELIALADKAMYRAKALGRNRVVVWQDD
jgi:diguanylate cyclase (GGDEF)-like protein/PAS domain S-box-containing protein